ncbi:MAG: DUF3137 domain-containing protein [Bacteroidales bacterium]
MKSLGEFRKFFDSDLYPVLQVLDQRRRKVVRRSMWVLLVAVMLLLLWVVLFVRLDGASHTGSLGLFLIIAVVLTIAGAILAGAYWAKDKDFYHDFKRQIIEPVVKFVSPQLEYDPDNHIGIDSFQRSRLFLKSADRFSGDDLVLGKLDKTQIWFSEVKAEYKTTTSDGKGRTKTTWHTLFKGLFFIADFNKHFQTSTIVLPNRYGRGFLANFFKKMNLARREKLVKLEDPEFNKYFNVYGEDQVEARYVLSTSLMQRITAFRRKHPNPLYISFVNSFLYIAISYKRDLFEPGWFKKLARFELVQEYFEDIQLAVSIVEELNLNNRVWTKS